LLLTTEALVADKPEKGPDPAAAAAAMGGMGGMGGMM
jgi:chaperonin GroEL